MEPIENIPDPEIEELKEIVKRQGQVIEETNRMLHSMRRGQRLRTLWSVVWWAAIIAVSAGAYYYYLQPYITTLEQYYANFQHSSAQAQTLESQISNWFKQFAPGATTTPAQ